MLKKAKLAPALAFSLTFIPIVEVAAIAVVARHDFAMFSVPIQHHSSTVRMTVVQSPFSVSGRPASVAGSERVVVNGFHPLNRHAVPPSMENKYDEGRESI